MARWLDTPGHTQIVQINQLPLPAKLEIGSDSVEAQA
jgi:hypothetical protein